MGKYIYESHMGGLYTSEEQLSWDDLYCDSCGDTDWELGYCETRSEAKKLIEKRDLWHDSYVKEFLDKNFSNEEES